MDWWRDRLREARWLELSVEESVRVSLDMDGSRPERERRKRELTSQFILHSHMFAVKGRQISSGSAVRRSRIKGLKVRALKLNLA